MAIKRKALAWAGVVCVSVIAALFSSQQSAQGLREDPDFLAQIATVANINALVDHIEVYQDEHDGSNPPSLKVLCDDYGMDAKFLSDGWGRPLVYYAGVSSYALLSFGRNGTPEGQLADPGGIGQRRDYNLDIGWLQEEWVQTPYAVDR